MAAWAQLCLQGKLGEDPRDPRAWPLPSASPETAIGNETDSYRLMRRPRPPCVQEAATTAIAPRAHSVAAPGASGPMLVRARRMLVRAWRLLVGRVELRCVFFNVLFNRNMTTSGKVHGHAGRA